MIGSISRANLCDPRPGFIPQHTAMMNNRVIHELPSTLTLPALPVFQPDEINAFCVKCKTCHPMLSPQLVATKSGTPAARGKCPVCHTTMMKFLPNRYI